MITEVQESRLSFIQKSRLRVDLMRINLILILLKIGLVAIKPVIFIGRKFSK